MTIISITFFTFLCIIAVFNFKNNILLFLYGETAIRYSYLLIEAIITAGLISLIWFFISILTIINKFKIILLINSIGVLICVLTSLLIIPVYGLNSVNYIQILAFSIIAVCMLAFIINNKLVKN